MWKFVAQLKDEEAVIIGFAVINLSVFGAGVKILTYDEPFLKTVGLLLVFFSLITFSLIVNQFMYIYKKNKLVNTAASDIQETKTEIVKEYVNLTREETIDQETESIYQDGSRFMREKQYDRAIEVFQSLELSFPAANRTGCAVLYLGTIFQSIGKFDLAEYYYSRAYLRYYGCYYLDGVMVGPLAKFRHAKLAEFLNKAELAKKLCLELQGESSAAIDHIRRKLVEQIPRHIRTDKGKYDVFISYAFEDKAFVDELAKRLRETGIKVWYDEFEIGIGNNIRAKVNEGLQHSDYGIVVLSKKYLSKKSWPQYELDALVIRKNREGRDLLLPVWHGITQQELQVVS